MTLLISHIMNLWLLLKPFWISERNNHLYTFSDIRNNNIYIHLQT